MEGCFWQLFVPVGFLNVIEWSKSYESSEAATVGFLKKKIFLKISQNSQDNTCARVCFLIKLKSEACSYTWIRVNCSLFKKAVSCNRSTNKIWHLQQWHTTYWISVWLIIIEIDYKHFHVICTCFSAVFGWSVKIAKDWYCSTKMLSRSKFIYDCIWIWIVSNICDELFW